MVIARDTHGMGQQSRESVWGAGGHLFALPFSELLLPSGHFWLCLVGRSTVAENTSCTNRLCAVHEMKGKFS
jgi:hypothetical protein